MSPAARCNACHGNAGANASFGGGGNRNFDTGVEAARSLALGGFPKDGGFRPTPLNPDGSFGDETFNTTPLIEAADTGPFFHTEVTVSGASAHNAASAQTIEQAIAFYDSPAFNTSPAAAAGLIDLTATQIDDLGRFLRTLNASFNLQLAQRRLQAALTVLNAFADTQVATQRGLLELSQVEVVDALDVLTGASGLSLQARAHLTSARQQVGAALAAPNARSRRTAVQQALDALGRAQVDLGTGLTFAIGEGTLMF